MNKTDHFDAIAIAVASPEQILSWSHGEVKKPETINYRTQKPERDGLFCEKIFGPTKNWECYCGKYKRIRYKGVICEKCGVEVTRSIVRRQRMGHLKLAVPVTHIWFLRSTPSRIGLLLDLPIKTIEQVVYFAAYIITEIDQQTKQEAMIQLNQEYNSLKQKIQSEFKEKVKETKNGKELKHIEKELAKKIEDLDDQHRTAKEELGRLTVTKVLSELEYRDLSMKFGHVFKAGSGAESIRNIIDKIDLEKMVEDMKKELKKSSGQKAKKIIKRIKLAGSLIKAGIKPAWMILTVLPVLPPDLRPMVQLDGGRFAASDLNDLYRRVINRNNRLKRLISIGAPEVICRNEKRMMQEAVDTLLNNNAREGKTVFNSGDKRKLRSLSDMLKGKQGRFRQNLLGKRVDYSGRSVIVIGPKLKLNQCGLPKVMALELFKPFVIGKLIREGYAHNIKSAEKLMQAGEPIVWDKLEEVTSNHYVLLNRAPTLHRLGIQAFQPILVEGKAIQIHPLVCPAFNADFDGDQMAVHVPLSYQAQREAKELMLASNNILKPSAGEPIIGPTQEMIMGCYYLTKMIRGLKGEGMVLATINEAITAYRLGYIALQSPVKARVDGNIIETTVGRLIFNSFIPQELGFQNETMNKSKLNDLISLAFHTFGNEKTAQMADEMKRIGFKFATKSGLSIAASDMIIPSKKQRFIDEASAMVEEINKKYWKGFLTNEERYNHIINIWSETKSKVTTAMIENIKDDNDIFYMIDSGARGNWGQITQLCGIKGLVANPAGKTIELPIKANLKEGFTILEYFIATHGGRKGKSDTALKTAEAGYLTRRLVDAGQDVIIKQNDCGSTEQHIITEEESKIIGESFTNRIYGKVLAADLTDPKTGEILFEKGTEIDKQKTKVLIEHKVKEVKVRSIITCKTQNGICQKCYGKDLGTNKTVDIGTAIGIIAAQSIGEPGTQLTMRTFHMGGVAEGQDITQGLTRVEELFEAREPKSSAVLAEFDGRIQIRHKNHQTIITLSSNQPQRKTYYLEESFEPTVKVGNRIKEKEMIAKLKESKKIMRAEENGKIIEVNDDSIILETTGTTTINYDISAGKILKVKNNQMVKRGDPLTFGPHSLRDILRLTNIYTVQKYIVNEVQSIYASQGQTINDKHIEIIARQMLSKSRIIDPGDTSLLPGEIVDHITFENEKEKIKGKNKKLVRAERLLLGLTRISLYTASWLAAASFQETIRVLVEAATTRKVDRLEGLKENVIIGKLIPAGAIYRKNIERLHNTIN